GQDGGGNSERRATYLLDNVQLDFSPLSQGFAADFDNDGDVDGEDLVHWQNAYSQSPDGDADGDGDTDGRDFLVWQRQFGSGVAAEISTHIVPEPSGITFVLILSAVCWLRRS